MAVLNSLSQSSRSGQTDLLRGMSYGRRSLCRRSSRPGRRVSSAPDSSRQYASCQEPVNWVRDPGQVPVQVAHHLRIVPVGVVLPSAVPSDLPTTSREAACFPEVLGVCAASSAVGALRAQDLLGQRSHRCYSAAYGRLGHSVRLGDLGPDSLRRR